jgi:hypothetical protein
VAAKKKLPVAKAALRFEGGAVKVAPMKGPEKTPDGVNPEEITRALEMELQLKRASWQRMRERRGVWRMLSLLFLLLVLAGALLTYLYLQPQLHHRAKPEQSSRVMTTR